MLLSAIELLRGRRCIHHDYPINTKEPSLICQNVVVLYMEPNPIILQYPFEQFHIMYHNVHNLAWPIGMHCVKLEKSAVLENLHWCWKNNTSVLTCLREKKNSTFGHKSQLFRLQLELLTIFLYNPISTWKTSKLNALKNITSCRGRQTIF